MKIRSRTRLIRDVRFTLTEADVNAIVRQWQLIDEQVPSYTSDEAGPLYAIVAAVARPAQTD